MTHLSRQSRKSAVFVGGQAQVPFNLLVKQSTHRKQMWFLLNVCPQVFPAHGGNKAQGNDCRVYAVSHYQGKSTHKEQ